MSVAVGVDLKDPEVESLAQVVEAGLLAHVALFQEVSACARSEMALHQRLVAIKAEWADVQLPCIPYRGDPTLATLGSLEQIQLMLDDHILRYNFSN
jgi:hypothetical protein